MANKIELAALFLKEELAKVGIIMAHIVQAQSGSSYHSFPECPKLGKLRISDHKEKTEYGYRWQIRLDQKGKTVINSKGHNQFFFGKDSLKEAVSMIKNYAAKINGNPKLEESIKQNEVVRNSWESGRPPCNTESIDLNFLKRWVE